MFVVVVAVDGVAMSVVDVVDVVAVRNGDMTTTFTVGVLVPVMCDMLALLAFVVMVVVHPVQVPIVHVIDVVTMGN